MSEPTPAAEAAPPRHCIVRQLPSDKHPWIEEYALASTVLFFRDRSTGIGVRKSGAPEMDAGVGRQAGRFPGLFAVEWRDGEAPAERPVVVVPRSRVKPRQQPPTETELADDGLPLDQRDAAHAFQRWLYNNAVWPYGQKGAPPDLNAPGFQRLLKPIGETGGSVVDPEAYKAAGRIAEIPRDIDTEIVDAVKAANAAADAYVAEADPEPGATPGDAPPKPTHFERRRAHLLGLAETNGGGQELRAIATALGLRPGASKAKLVAAILAEEFPHQGE